MAYCEHCVLVQRKLNVLFAFANSVIHCSVQSVFLSQTSQLVLWTLCFSVCNAWLCLKVSVNLWQFRNKYLWGETTVSPGSQSLTVQKLPVVSGDSALVEAYMLSCKVLYIVTVYFTSTVALANQKRKFNANRFGYNMATFFSGNRLTSWPQNIDYRFHVCNLFLGWLFVVSFDRFKNILQGECNTTSK